MIQAEHEYVLLVFERGVPRERNIQELQVLDQVRQLGDRLDPQQVVLVAAHHQQRTGNILHGFVRIAGCIGVQPHPDDGRGQAIEVRRRIDGLVAVDGRWKLVAPTLRCHLGQNVFDRHRVRQVPTRADRYELFDFQRSQAREPVRDDATVTEADDAQTLNTEMRQDVLDIPLHLLIGQWHGSKGRFALTPAIDSYHSELGTQLRQHAVEVFHAAEPAVQEQQGRALLPASVFVVNPRAIYLQMLAGCVVKGLHAQTSINRQTCAAFMRSA